MHAFIRIYTLTIVRFKIHKLVQVINKLYVVTILFIALRTSALVLSCLNLGRLTSNIKLMNVFIYNNIIYVVWWWLKVSTFIESVQSASLSVLIARMESSTFSCTPFISGERKWQALFLEAMLLRDSVDFINFVYNY